ncbi:hypothetical protein H4582DRAFT_2172216 [Lactarius indigo]|nr:hypothetical protein H4582DRAFT_2172216 [Lactarius indigo]
MNTLALLNYQLDNTRLQDKVNAAEWPTARCSQTSGGSPEGPWNFLEVTKSPWVCVVGRGFFMWSVEHYVELFNKLMISLGYSEYVTQGVDWCHVVRTPHFDTHYSTASKYGPKYVKVSHPKATLTARRLNSRQCDPPRFRESPIMLLTYLISFFTVRERQFFQERRGPLNRTATKPQTLGFILADSPVGLLAWIYEKFITWIDAYPWAEDEGGSRFIGSRAVPAASVRIYYELALAGQVINLPKTTVPSYFQKNLVRFPELSPLLYCLFGTGKGRVSSWSTRSAGISRRTSSPKRSVGNFRKMSANLEPSLASSRDIPAIDRTERLRMVHKLSTIQLGLWHIFSYLYPM